MSDNTTLNPGTGGDQVRTLAKTANAPAKTQVTIIDVGGGADGASEIAWTGGVSQVGSWSMSLTGTATVSGSVSVSNFPATQAISAASLPLPSGAATAALQPAVNGDGGALAHVTNFPATQPVSLASLPSLAAGANVIGAVSQNGTWTTGRSWTLSSAGDSVLAAQSGSWAVTATISGTPTVTVSNSSFAVTGTFWQATQPVSLASLPSLPAGSNAIGSITNTSFAATQATAANLNATVVGTGTFAVQASLNAGANTIGNVGVNNQAVGAGALATAQATPETSATLILAARTGAAGTGRVAATILNSGAVTIFFGPAGVTTSTGVPLQPGASATINTTAAIYAITASGTGAVAVLETF